MKRINFKNKIMIWVLVINMIPLVFSYAIFFNEKIKTDENNITKNLLEAARVVSTNSEIKNNLQLSHENNSIEKKVDELIEIFRDIDIIVVANINGIKYSHLDKSQIGDKFVNPVEWDKIKNGEGYFSKMLGSMGVTFRRFEPIYAENREIIGFVMVGKYYKTISDTNRKTTLMLGILFITSFSLALILALNFAKKIRKSLFGLDPEEIGRLYIEERLIIDNLESGLIALNTKNEILKVNSVFSKKYKNLSTEVILNKISSYLEKNENTARNIEVLIEGGYYYIKILPIYDLNEYYGTILLIKTKDDVNKYAREITGIDQLVDGMRANIHEFKNRLHVILGLINLEKIEMAKKYILEIQDLNEYDFKKFINIKNSFLKAILLGKDAICKERKIQFILNSESVFLIEERTPLIEDISTIIGNLIENSIESFKESNLKEKLIEITIIESEKEIAFKVTDNGEKIPQENFTKIYEQGFSTKGVSRGVGLNIVKNKVNLYSGTIEFEQNENMKFFKVRVMK
ncbi:MAG: ATP-binding protein [Cetobacterium sp.]